MYLKNNFSLIDYFLDSNHFVLDSSVVIYFSAESISGNLYLFMLIVLEILAQNKRKK